MGRRAWVRYLATGVGYRVAACLALLGVVELGRAWLQVRGGG